jgi:hypothetical protein
MSHETFQAQLLDLAYGELKRREARRLEAHLEGCAACRAELARIRETRAAMSPLQDEPAPEAGEAILLAAAREAARRRERPAPLLPSWLWAGSTVAVALAAVVAISYRVLSIQPGPLGREDPEALLGTGAPEPAAPEAEAAEAEAPASARPPAPSGDAPADAGRRVAPSSRAEAKSERAKEGPAWAGAPDALRDLREERARRDRAGGPPLAAAPPPPPAAPSASSSNQPRAEQGPAEEAAPDEADAFAGAPPAAAPEPAARSAAKALSVPARERSVVGEAPSRRMDGERLAPGEASGGQTGAAARAPARGAALAEAAGAEDAFARYARLSAEGRLRTAAVLHPGCPGESSRKVETDPAGRVVKYTRRGARGGLPFEVELFYGSDGLLGAVRYREADGPVREVRLGGAGGAAGAATRGAIPAAALEPLRATDARLDAPARCEF